ncbi:MULTISPECIES: GNAT family N-acetyltransferase [Clavibacter]|jgi:ribosomal-protein-alanine N-acetyltransferase|uniref:GNAT family N-acetyltransferase n=1 Tax=Clavibacter TaxID=1573 RepID=UPI000E66B9B0|nr:MULTISPECIES: GNAT family protein [Clavibacter]MCJ1712369.1 GNAT family N-acetyltransferase [Clavibacter phaseoli]RII90611.1 N-acetyltransferase [Clavibacter michiganensis]RIJ55282.1 N-acetyltransferase [Clavibacter phaseoli]RIJ58152.1 N-acetyltransferase [Clavibacter phaseoli]UKF29844.1 GNAT family N-acetyltransferase [Clavibacter phaseoli]
MDVPQTVPTMRDGRISVRPIRLRDSRALERSLLDNRSWLRKWEATSPYAPMAFDTRASIRSLQANARAGLGVPLVIDYDDEFAGQLNVSSIAYGSLSSATIGYWVGQEFAGRNVTPTAVALATDYCFTTLGLHRMEICIRPENAPSLRVVQKLGFRYEGLRRRYIHINGDWRDHFCFGLVVEELSTSVLARWKEGGVDPEWSRVPDADVEAAAAPLAVQRRI